MRSLSSETELLYILFYNSGPKTFALLIGPPKFIKLKMMVPSLKQIQALDCEFYQLGNHFRSSFPKKSKTQCNFVFFFQHSFGYLVTKSCHFFWF